MTDVGIDEYEVGGVDEPPRSSARRSDSADDTVRKGRPAAALPPRAPAPPPPPAPPSLPAQPPTGRRRRRQTVHPDLHVHEHEQVDPLDRPFLNPLTATIDLSGLRRRLAMEELGRIDFEPRLYGKPRSATFDAEGTQTLRRPGPHGTPGRGIDLPTHRGPGEADVPFGLEEVVDSVETRELRYGLRDLELEAAGGSTGGSGGSAKGDDDLTPSSAKSRAIWTLLDQVVSAGTNTLIALIVAKSVSETEFGAFSVAFALFALFIGLSRAVATSALGIRYAGVAPKVFHSAAAAATGTGFSVGLVTGISVVVAGTAMGGLVGESLVAIGILFPGLLLQDAWRYVFFAQGRPSAAFANDALWAVVQLAAVFLLITRDVKSSSAMLLAWGGAAAIAALVGVAQAGVWPAPERAREWVTGHRDISGFITLEFIMVQGAQQASFLAIGALSSLSTVGALRGAQVLLGPTTVLAVGIVSFAIPELSRRKDMAAGARLKAAYALSALVMSAGIAWGLVFVVLPDSFGAFLLGDTWPAVNDILLLTIVQQAGAASTIGASCVMYSLGRTKLTFRGNLFLSPQLVIWPLIGVLVGGVHGAVAGYIVAFWAPVPLWFYLLRKSVREHEQQRDRAEDEAPAATGRQRGADRPAAGRSRQADTVTRSDGDG